MQLQWNNDRYLQAFFAGGEGLEPGLAQFILIRGEQKRRNRLFSIWKCFRGTAYDPATPRFRIFRARPKLSSNFNSCQLGTFDQLFVFSLLSSNFWRREKASKNFR